MADIALARVLVVARKRALGNEFFQNGYERTIPFVLKEAIARFDDAVTSLCKKPDFYTFLSLANGERNLVAVTQNFVARNYGANGYVDFAYFLQGLRDIFLLINKLLIVAKMLNITATALAKMWTGRDNAVRGGRDDFL